MPDIDWSKVFEKPQLHSGLGQQTKRARHKSPYSIVFYFDNEGLKLPETAQIIKLDLLARHRSSSIAAIWLDKPPRNEGLDHVVIHASQASPGCARYLRL